MHLGDEGEYPEFLYMFAVSHNDRTTYCKDGPRCLFYADGRYLCNLNSMLIAYFLKKYF